MDHPRGQSTSHLKTCASCPRPYPRGSSSSDIVIWGMFLSQLLPDSILGWWNYSLAQRGKTCSPHSLHVDRQGASLSNSPAWSSDRHPHPSSPRPSKIARKLPHVRDSLLCHVILQFHLFWYNAVEKCERPGICS